MSVVDRLAALGCELPPVAAGNAKFASAVCVGNFIFVSGHTPAVNGVLPAQGRLGAEVNVETGRECARLALLKCLAAAQQELGDLSRLESVVKLTVFVASAPEFRQQPQVADAASELLQQIFLPPGGRHARAAVGVASLPGGAPVEVELIGKVAD